MNIHLRAVNYVQGIVEIFKNSQRKSMGSLEWLAIDFFSAVESPSQSTMVKVRSQISFLTLDRETETDKIVRCVSEGVFTSLWEVESLSVCPEAINFHKVLNQYSSQTRVYESLDFYKLHQQSVNSHDEEAFSRLYKKYLEIDERDIDTVLQTMDEVVKKLSNGCLNSYKDLLTLYVCEGSIRDLYRANTSITLKQLLDLKTFLKNPSEENFRAIPMQEISPRFNFVIQNLSGGNIRMFSDLQSFYDRGLYRKMNQEMNFYEIFQCIYCVRDLLANPSKEGFNLEELPLNNSDLNRIIIHESEGFINLEDLFEIVASDVYKNLYVLCRRLSNIQFRQVLDLCREIQEYISYSIIDLDQIQERHKNIPGKIFSKIVRDLTQGRIQTFSDLKSFDPHIKSAGRIEGVVEVVQSIRACLSNPHTYILDKLNEIPEYPWVREVIEKESNYAYTNLEGLKHLIRTSFHPSLEIVDKRKHVLRLRGSQQTYNLLHFERENIRKLLFFLRGDLQNLCPITLQSYQKICASGQAICVLIKQQGNRLFYELFDREALEGWLSIKEIHPTKGEPLAPLHYLH